MDNTNNHSKTWSDSDIRMYLNGELSPREMHELERAALDDPFLADALEGYRTVPPEETGWDDLRTRLAARIDKKEQRRAIPWFRRSAFRVAAVVIGLLGIGLISLEYFTRGKSRLNVDLARAYAPQKPAAPPQTPAATADTTALNLDTNTDLASGLVAKEDHDLIRTPRSVKKRAILRAKASPDEAPASKNRADDQIAAAPLDHIANGLHIEKDTVQLQNKDLPDPMKMARAGQPLFFTGKVVDVNNRPLAGASVFLNTAPKTITTTDASGFFNFRLRPRDTSQQMTVSLVGYKQTLVPLNSNALTNNIIQLEEAKARLNEVVVVGYGSKRKEAFAAVPSEAGDERLDSAWQKVFPIIGKPAYQQYLDTAKRSLHLDSTIIGTERVSFEVDQKGQITDFKIEQSLSPAHDAGTIQLITTGPTWRSLRGKKTRAVVSLRFP